MQVAGTGETMSGDSDAAYHDDDDWQAALLLLDQANCEGMSSDAIPLLPQPQEQQEQQEQQPQRHTSWTPSTYSSSGWSMQGGPSSTMPHVRARFPPVSAFLPRGNIYNVTLSVPSLMLCGPACAPRATLCAPYRWCTYRCPCPCQCPPCSMMPYAARAYPSIRSLIITTACSNPCLY